MERQAAHQYHTFARMRRNKPMHNTQSSILTPKMDYGPTNLHKSISQSDFFKSEVTVLEVQYLLQQAKYLVRDIYAKMISVEHAMDKQIALGKARIKAGNRVGAILSMRKVKRFQVEHVRYEKGIKALKSIHRDVESTMIESQELALVDQEVDSIVVDIELECFRQRVYDCKKEMETYFFYSWDIPDDILLFELKSYSNKVSKLFIILYYNLKRSTRDCRLCS